MTDKQDLIVLLADLDAENAVRSLLSCRTTDMGIRTVSYDTTRHSMRDSGCFRQAPDLLRSYLRTHSHALVLFDRHGCGKDKDSPELIEKDVESRLRKNGWSEDNSACVVLDPELEIWVWTTCDAVAEILGFGPKSTALTHFLTTRNLLPAGRKKPSDPKSAMEQCLRQARKPRSARLFSKLAEKLPFRSCEDRSFIKFRRTLELWFSKQLLPVIEMERKFVE